MEKVGNMQKQTHNVGSELENLEGGKKRQKVKNTTRGMKNVFNGFIIKMEIASEGISELENTSI